MKKRLNFVFFFIIIVIINLFNFHYCDSNNNEKDEIKCCSNVTNQQLVVEFTSNVVENEFIVQFKDYYDKDSRKKYIKSALLNSVNMFNYQITSCYYLILLSF